MPITLIACPKIVPTAKPLSNEVALFGNPMNNEYKIEKKKITIKSLIP
jgi:hypothetical protein